MDIYFISDFTIKSMKNVPIKMIEQGIPVTSFSLDQLHAKHKNTPQDPCPLVFEGHGPSHGGGHGDSHGDSHGDGHGDDHGDSHSEGHGDHGDSHSEGHGDHGYSHKDEDGDKHDDIHGGHDNYGHNDEKIKDYQTDSKSFYTIAQEYPNDFAKPSMCKLNIFNSPG